MRVRVDKKYKTRSQDCADTLVVNMGRDLDKVVEGFAFDGTRWVYCQWDAANGKSLDREQAALDIFEYWVKS